MSLPDLLSVEDVMARHGFASRRAALGLMRRVGLVGGRPRNRPVVRLDDLDRFERESAEANAKRERASVKPVARSDRREVACRPASSPEDAEDGPGWWRT